VARNDPRAAGTVAPRHWLVCHSVLIVVQNFTRNSHCRVESPVMLYAPLAFIKGGRAMDPERVVELIEEIRVHHDAAAVVIEQFQARLADLMTQAGELQKQLDAYLNVTGQSTPPRE
jgi:hypothetical protein